MGRKSKSEIRKPEILEHFYQILSEYGYAGATLEKTAQRMGVHSSLIIHYFNTKEDMTVALVDSITEKYENFAREKVASLSEPEERLQAYLDILLSREWINLIDKRVFYTCLELNFRIPRVRKRLHKMYNRFKQLLIDELTELMHNGVIQAKDPEKLSVFVMSLLEGFHMYEAFVDESPSFEEISGYLKDTALDLLK